jgi:hypothetical protein
MRKAPKMTKAVVMKIIRNPNTPKGLKAYWKKVAKKRGYI